MTEATRDMLDGLRRETISSEQVAYVMLQVRKELEAREEWKGKFSVLNFYCDWCAHYQIDRDKHCETIIRELNKCLWQLDDEGNMDPTRPTNVAGFFKISQLCKELEVVLSAMSGQLVAPTQTFVFALFKYLKNVPVAPIDALDGRLKNGSKAYEKLCQDLQVGESHPLLKNFTIIDVDETAVLYRVEMEGVKSEIQGQIDFPVCTEPPFVFMLERKKEGEFEELAQRVQWLYQMRRLEEASACIKKMKAMAPKVKGMDQLKAMMYHFGMEVDWALTGDLAVLAEGEKAIDYIADLKVRSDIYHNMAVYALQKNDEKKTEYYIEKSLENAELHVHRGIPLKLKGRLLFQQKRYDEAMDVYGEAAEYAERYNQTELLIYIIWGMTDVLAAKGQFQTAISELTRAEQLARDSKRIDILVRTSMLKAQILIKSGDSDTALHVVERIPRFND